MAIPSHWILHYLSAPMGVDDEAMAYRFVAFDTTADAVKVRVVGVEHAPGGVFRLTARDEIPEYYDGAGGRSVFQSFAHPKSLPTYCDR